MAGPWITNDELKQRVADMLGYSLASMVAKWLGIIPDANDSAAQDITGALSDRGYTAAQINGWDRRFEFNRDLGTFWALTRGGGLANYTDVMINKLDRRKELMNCAVAINGVAISPGDSGGGVSIGRFNETGNRITDNTQL